MSESNWGNKGMPGEHEVETTGGLSRRQLLTRSAIAGGLVWAAPIIRTTAAYATTANGTERPCTTFYMVTIDPKGKVRPEPKDLNTRDVPPAIRQWFADNPGVTVQFPAVKPLLTQTSMSGWAVLLPEVTGPNAAGRQCRMVIGWDEKRHKYAEGYVDPNPPLASEVGLRLIFPCPDPNHTGGGGDGDHDGDDDGTGKGGKNDGDSDDKKSGDDGGGCKAGHDDGDHDADDVACDPTAVGTAEGATGTGTADATGTTGATATDPSLSASSTTATSSATDTSSTTGTSSAIGSSQIASDGSASNSISSDGQPSQSVSSDGTPSSHDSSGPGDCINLVYLIYCCPQ